MTLPMQVDGRTKSLILSGVAFGAFCLATGDAQAQYVNMGCKWTDKSVEVLFNPGTLAANGFIVDRFRDEMNDAAAIWNEEGQGQYDLLYQSDSAATNPVPGSLLVTHQNTWFCSDNALAKAFWGAAGTSCDTNGNIIRVILQDSCNPGVVRGWRTAWPGPTFDPHTCLSGACSYESVMGHEFMHGLALPDEGNDGQRMGCCGNSHTAFLLLYPIDTTSIRVQSGATTRRLVTAASATGSAWGATSPLNVENASQPPSLDTRSPGTGQVRALHRPPDNRFLAVIKGTHGAWSGSTSVSDITDKADHAYSLAYSSFGEILAVWLDDCNTSTACDLDWAYSANDGGSWTRGTLTDVNTHTRATVDYDHFADRFVLAYINAADSRIMTRSALAISPPGWSSPVVTTASAYRYLGGIAFNRNTGAGLLVAAANSAHNKGRIAQFQVDRSGANYTLSTNAWLTNPPALARTRRPFGIAFDQLTSRVLVAWRDVGSPRPMAVATKFGISVGTFSNPSFPISNIVNGVDVTFDSGSGVFLAGFSAQ